MSITNCYFRIKFIINLIITMIFLLFIQSNIYANFSQSLGLENNDFITVNQAFQVQAEVDSHNVVLWFKVLPRTYLYKNSFKFHTTPKVALAKAIFPTGIIKNDEHFGRSEVFTSDFRIQVPYTVTNKESINFIVNYQGCLDKTFCYPPQTKSFNLILLANKNTTNSFVKSKQSVSLQHNNRLQNYDNSLNNMNLETIISSLKNDHLFSVILLFFVAGILLSFTPCVLPMLPILSSIIIGKQKNITKLRSVSYAFSYVQGMALAYAILGVVVALFGTNMQLILQNYWFILITSFVILLLSFFMFDWLKFNLPQSLSNWQNRINNCSSLQQGGNYLGVFFMGVLSTLLVSPCTTIPLTAAFLFIADQGSIFLGGTALYFMGLGIGLPLLLICSSYGHILPKAGQWMNVVRSFFGILLILTSIYLLSRIWSAVIIMALLGVLFIFIAVYCSVFNTQTDNKSRFLQAIALLCLIYGSMLIIGATQGNEDIFHPLGKSLVKKIAISKPLLMQQKTDNFITVKTKASLLQNLALAQQEKVSAIVDTYADWCISCKIIEREVLNDVNVQRKLRKCKLIKLDVSNYSKDIQQAMNMYKIFNPPTFLFFDKHGELINRLVGEFSKDKFLSVVDKICL